jgi:hypothetical protein
VDGQTGYLITELVLTDSNFSKKIDSVTGLSLHQPLLNARNSSTSAPKSLPTSLERKETACDTICLVLPAHKDKFDTTLELIEAAKKANVPTSAF